MIKSEGTIEGCLETIEELNADPSRKKKYLIPDRFLYKESRELFKHPDVLRDMDKIKEELKWSKPTEDKVREFLIDQKAFAEMKVESGLKKLMACKDKGQ
jgi:flap endonuclease-1